MGRMRRIFLLILLIFSVTLSTIQAETADPLSDDGYSAHITISIDSTSDLTLSGDDIASIVKEIGAVFLIALQQTARFSSTVIDSADADFSNYDSGSMVVNLILSQVFVETDSESGRKIFHAEAAAESYISNQRTNDPTWVEFNLLGIGETFEESLHSAADGLTYSVMSIVRMFPLPGASLAVYELYNNYPLVLFPEESIPSIGDAYNLVSGTGEVLGLADVSRLVPLDEGKGSAAELQIVYTDITIVPGVGIQPFESSLVQMQSSAVLSYGAVGADLSFSGTNRQGFVPAAGVGAVWVWDNPYPIGSFFIQQANTVIPLVSGGFVYRMIPGRRLSKPGNLFFGRVRIDLEALFVGGYLFNLISPTGNDVIYGSRFAAGMSWYITDSVEVSAKCRYDRIYSLNGSFDPLLSTIFGSIGVTFSP
jgi:hypothetical protein